MFIAKKYHPRVVRLQMLFVLICAGVIPGLSQSSSYQMAPEEAILLSQYIQKKSLSGFEKEAGGFLADICRNKGLIVEELQSPENSYNFAASLYPLSHNKPNIIFLNHIDVVPEGNAGSWLHEPFSGTIADNSVWGRGAIDLKGVAIMQLMAIEKAKQWAGEETLPYNVTLLCVSGEEMDNQGIKDVIEHSFKKLNPAVVFGEGGTGLSQISGTYPEQPFYCISVSEKKALWLKLSLSIQTSGHGSVPPPLYANKVMTQALNRLLEREQEIIFDETTVAFFKTVGRYEKGIRKLVLKHPRLFKGLMKKALREDPIILSILTNTITVTNINNAQLSTNQIAPEIEVLLDCRLLPGTDPGKFIEDIRDMLDVEDIRITVLKETPSAPASERGNFYKQLQSAIEEVYDNSAVLPVLSPAHSDNNFLRRMGVPVYGLTPVQLTQAQLLSFHNSNEHITLNQLQAGIKVYENLLRNLLLN
ncbi:MAG: M20/M25/M40 family metallo-hydrolase [Chitinophagaceae bacterium]|nr:M20/M25/M40 family metallo-hydrolase [Chitinophagaceae bacterium]